MKKLNEVYRIVSKVYFALNIFFVFCAMLFLLIPFNSGMSSMQFYLEFKPGVVITVLILIAFSTLFAYCSQGHPLLALIPPFLWYNAVGLLMAPIAFVVYVAGLSSGMTNTEIMFDADFIWVMIFLCASMLVLSLFAAFAIVVSICRAVSARRRAPDEILES